ncbi:MAG: hypothetical protein HYU66_12505 [Armatimonadetes bacterium]|nr:hypothetical protein [Armatimonadota bacterium]
MNTNQPDQTNTHRRLAAELFNHTWSLLDKPDRTQDEDDEMLHAAHASRYHWSLVGDASNLQVGEWQIARVYSVLGRAEPAQFHAQRALEWCERGGLGAFYVGCAHEVLARAAWTAGDHEAFADHLAQADAIYEGLTDEEEREVLKIDLDELRARAGA